MIRLIKTSPPDALLLNGEAWTATVLEKIAAGIDPTPTELSRYRIPAIKIALLKETNGKCAYCESKFEHIAYGDVEHISPKSLDPSRIFNWDNLTLACDVCNTNKGNNFPFGEGLIDPYVKTPSDHFRIVGPLIFGLPGDDDARLTELTLKLNRPALIERRQQKINYLREQVEVIARAPARLQSLLKENLQAEILGDQEYSAIASEYLAPYIRHNPPPVSITLGAAAP